MLFSQSGGLVYHARAWRRAGGWWRPFREHVAQWLGQALPPSGELVLVGPSAGHCLPLAQLAAFDRMLILEPDPLARWLLQRRLRAHQPRVSCEVEARDLLVAPLLRGSSGLEQLLERRPRAAVLFCNVLGQLQLDLPQEKQAAFEDAFRARILPQLAGRRWASFHDRWSLDWSFEPQASVALPEAADFASPPNDAELGRRWFGEQGPPVEVLDHGTSQLFPFEGARRYLSWRIADRALHIVEALPVDSARINAAAMQIRSF